MQNIYLGKIANNFSAGIKLKAYENIVSDEAAKASLKTAGFEHYMASTQSCVDLAVGCLENVLKENNLKAGDVDAIIYASEPVPTLTFDIEFGDRLIDLGLATAKSICMVGAQCANYGIQFNHALTMMRSDSSVNTVILLSVGKCPEQWNRNYFSNTHLLSDGATGCLLTKEPTSWRIDASTYRMDKMLRRYEMLGTPQGDMSAWGILQDQIDSMKTQILDETGQDIELSNQLFTNNSGLIWSKMFARMTGVPFTKTDVSGMKRYGHMFGAEALANFQDYVTTQPKNGSSEGLYTFLFSGLTGCGMVTVKPVEE